MAIVNFRHRSVNDSIEDALSIGQVMKEGDLTNEEIVFLKKIQEAGFHWKALMI